MLDCVAYDLAGDIRRISFYFWRLIKPALAYGVYTVQHNEPANQAAG